MLPSLDKEGQTAADSWCRGGSKAVASPNRSARVSPQPPRCAFGPASPPQQRRGAYLGEPRMLRVANSSRRAWFESRLAESQRWG